MPRKEHRVPASLVAGFRPAHLCRIREYPGSCGPRPCRGPNDAAGCQNVAELLEQRSLEPHENVRRKYDGNARIALDDFGTGYSSLSCLLGPLRQAQDRPVLCARRPSRSNSLIFVYENPRIPPAIPPQNRCDRSSVFCDEVPFISVECVDPDWANLDDRTR